MSMPIIPGDLPRLIRERFGTAKEAGDLNFWPTEIAILHINRVPFQLIFCPALAKKPKAEKSSDDKKMRNPFLDPPLALRLIDITPAHYLVLNKFAIVPEHFILATTQYKEQTCLLEKDDLAAAYSCVMAYKAQGKGLFGFFNSGIHSGASQPHRHIQFLPVESMMSRVELADWKLLIDSLLTTEPADIPFSYYVAPISENMSAADLHRIYTSLHQRAINALVDCRKRGLDFLPEPNESEGSSSISYNMAMTDKVLVICPRRTSGMVLQTGEGSFQFTDMVELNGTLLGGTLLVKNEAQWNALKKDESQLSQILEDVGIPSCLRI